MSAFLTAVNKIYKAQLSPRTKRADITEMAAVAWSTYCTDLKKKEKMAEPAGGFIY